MSALKLAVRELGGRTIDKRTTLGRALIAWKDEHIEALGGETVVTPQQRTILDVAAITKPLHDSFSAWLIEEAVKGTLINKRRRSLAPAVQQRQVPGDALARYMTVLGLERVAKPKQSLEDYIAQKYGTDKPVPEGRPSSSRRQEPRRLTARDDMTSTVKYHGGAMAGRAVASLLDRPSRSWKRRRDGRRGIPR